MVRNLPPPRNMSLGACIIFFLLWVGSKFNLPNESKVPLGREGEDPKLPPFEIQTHVDRGERRQASLHLQALECL